MNVIKNPYNQKAVYHELPAHEYEKDTVVCADKNEIAYIYQDGALLTSVSGGEQMLGSIGGIKKGFMASKIKDVTIRYYVKESEIWFSSQDGRFPLENGEKGLFSGMARSKVLNFDVNKFEAYMKKEGLKPNPDGVILYQESLRAVMGSVIKGILYGMLPKLPFMDKNMWVWRIRTWPLPTEDERKFMDIISQRIQAAFRDFGMEVADTVFKVS